MTDDVPAVDTECAAPQRHYTRVFVAFALLLSVAAIASMVIAVSVPADQSPNYFGRSSTELVGPGYAGDPSPIMQVALPEECVPKASIRFTSPKHLQAVRICDGRLGPILPPVTVVNSPSTSRDFARLSQVLAEPSDDVSTVQSCPAIAWPPTYVAVRIEGRWLSVKLPQEVCGRVVPPVLKAIDAVESRAMKVKESRTHER